MDQAILAVDLTGRIVFWNRFAETLYGWPINEVQGRNSVEVLAAPLLMEAARANMGQAIHKVLNGGKTLVRPSRMSWWCMPGTKTIGRCTNTCLIASIRCCA